MSEHVSNRQVSPPDANTKSTIVEQAITGASAGAVLGSVAGLGGAIAGAIAGALVNNGSAIRAAFTHTDSRE
jgi:TctA family transporter